MQQKGVRGKKKDKISGQTPPALQEQKVRFRDILLNQ